MPKTNDYTISNVKKALEILEKLAESPEPRSLASLALAIEYSRNKTYRVLATLLEKGLVERDSITGAYQVGERIVVLGKKLADSGNLPRHAKERMRNPFEGSELLAVAYPIIAELARKHQEAVYITTISNNEVVFLNMVDSAQPVRVEPLIGKRFPFFTNAAGKVMKAVDSWDLLERICKRHEGAATRPDLDRLAAELMGIRATGVAVDIGGLGDDISSVAVAVRDYAGKVVGAITLLGPSFRMIATRIENEIVPSLLEGAMLFSQQLGYASS